MSQPTSAAGTAGQREADDRRLAGLFCRVAVGYWKGPTALQAWLLTLGLGAAVLFGIAGNVGISMWNRWFFDALEAKDASSAGWALLAFLGLAAAITAMSVCDVLARETVQVRWREWLTKRLFESWLGRQRFYHLSVADRDATVPEYRIADDIRWATEPIVDFYMVIIKAVVSIVSFVGILWIVGGGMTFGSGAGSFTIPAYMVIAAVLHGACITLVVLYFGNDLPTRMAARNEAEAHFRFALMRLRENAETVAMTRGEAGERESVGRSLTSLVRAWLFVVRKDGQLTWFLSGNGILLPVVPLLLAAPKYISGEISLGAVMQLATAYIPVQGAIAFIVEHFRAIANWHASARRVGELIQAMTDLDRDLDTPSRAGIVVKPSGDGRIQANDLVIASRHHQILVGGASFAIEPGEKVLLTGESGSGKSTLVRALVGLWPWGTGEVRLPRDAILAFVPQRPYLPLGSLRQAITYPRGHADADTQTIGRALERCGLAHLVPKLDRVERWDKLLSDGERQRFGFARLLVQRPDIVILDDAIAGLDDEGQAELMAIMRHDLAASTVISVSRRAGLERFHDRTLVLHRTDGGTRLRVASTRADASGDAPLRAAVQAG